jgi:hypothetical protein
MSRILAKVSRMRIHLEMDPPENPDIVIRPSAVWDTRRPLAVFLVEYRERLRRLNILSLARCRLLAELQQSMNDKPNLSARGFFKINKIKRLYPKLSHEIGISWSSYGYQLPEKVPNQRFDPPLGDIIRDLSLSLIDVRIGVVIQIVSAFEAFAQSWSLNYLLAKLENGVAWSPEERELAVLLSPIHTFTKGQKKRRQNSTPAMYPVNKTSHRVPDWLAILRTFPEVDNRLKQEPHIDFDPVTDEPIERHITDSLNAKVTLQFWRDFRNLIVHRSRKITTSFARKYQQLYSHLTEEQDWDVPDLRPGQYIYLHFEVPRVMGFTHRAACEVMDDLLFRLSKGSRGSGDRQAHWYAALDPKVTNGDLLLEEGDHALSFRWSADHEFRRDFVRAKN